MVGNKLDNIPHRKIKKENALKKLKKFDFDGYYETSALNNLNITEMIEECIISKK